MKKGQTKRVWTPEQKAEIVHKHLDEHISVRTLEKQYNADRSMICHWVKKYIAEGESSFIHKDLWAHAGMIGEKLFAEIDFICVLNSYLRRDFFAWVIRRIEVDNISRHRLPVVNYSLIVTGLYANIP